MNDQLIELAAQFGKAIAQTVALYLPALRRMADDEIAAVKQLLDQGNYDLAKGKLYHAMTPAEIVDEKEALAGQTLVMANKAAADRATRQAFGLEIFKAALGIAIAALL